MPNSPVFLLTISIHLSEVGSVNRVYLPTGKFFPPTITSALVKNAVASSAPVRHTSPNGTNSPKILRPRMRGLEYATLIVLPSANLHAALAGGLRTSWLHPEIAVAERLDKIKKHTPAVFLTFAPRFLETPSRRFVSLIYSVGFNTQPPPS